MQRFKDPIPHVQVRSFGFRGVQSYLSSQQMPAFTSGIVLLLGIWGGKRSGLSTDPNREMVDVHKCMRMLRACEKHWHSAGRLWDILYELASVGELPLPQPTPPSNKRERDSETPMSSPSTSSDISLSQGNGSRPIAGSRRVQKEALAGRHPIPTAPTLLDVHQIHSPQIQRQLHRPSSDSLRSTSSLSHQGPHSVVPSQPSSNNQPPQPRQPRPPSEHQFFSLPVYSQDLGKLPLHGHLEFSSAEQPSYWYNSLQASQPPPAAQGSLNLTSPSAPVSAPLSQASISQNSNSEDVRSYGNANASRMGQLPPYRRSPHAGASGGPYPAAGTAPGSASPSGGGGAVGQAYASTPSTGADAMLEGQRRAPADMQIDPFGTSASHVGPVNDGGAFQQQQQANTQQQQQQSQSAEMRYPSGYVDTDTMAMWSNAPTGFEMGEWDAFLVSNPFETAAAQSSLSFPHH